MYGNHTPASLIDQALARHIFDGFTDKGEVIVMGEVKKNMLRSTKPCAITQGTEDTVSYGSGDNDRMVVSRVLAMPVAQSYPTRSSDQKTTLTTKGRDTTVIFTPDSLHTTHYGAHTALTSRGADAVLYEAPDRYGDLKGDRAGILWALVNGDIKPPYLLCSVIASWPSGPYRNLGVTIDSRVAQVCGDMFNTRGDIDLELARKVLGSDAYGTDVIEKAAGLVGSNRKVKPDLKDAYEWLSHVHATTNVMTWRVIKYLIGNR